ncbi:diguanylate cyclase domain-containing protein [Dokdonella sp.]|uniref:GGDEF domain-containing protein n=1 Tax=Dokdonella sp. TaxID=2291710 RepID=UPI003528FED2
MEIHLSHGLTPASTIARLLALAWRWVLLAGLVLLGVAYQSCRAESVANEDLIRQLQALRVAGDVSTDVQQQLKQIEAQIPASADYPLQRERLKTRLAVLHGQRSFDEMLAMMQELRALAEANGDSDTVNLMDIRRVFMSHVDDDIGKYISQLNEVHARISSDASAEVMEALEVSYGNMYFDAGNFDSALRHQLAGLDWAAKLPVGSERARLFRLATIAELYNAMDLPESALETIDRAYALPIKTMPLQNRISLLAARAMAQLKEGNLDASEESLGEAEQLAKQDDSTFTALRLGNLRAEWQLASFRPKQAIEVIDRNEALARKSENTYYLAKCWMLRGHALMQLNRVDEGAALMQKATDFFQGKGQMIDVLDGLDRQIETLRGKQQFERAVTLMEQRQALWTQLFRNERARAIAELQARNIARELEHRVVTLSAENRMQEERLRAEKLGKALAVVIALFAISLSGLLFLAIRRARKERDKLSDIVRLDALTGASSRYQFQRRVKKKPSSSTGLKTGLLLLDLDHFKAINDQHGHEAGDAVLIAVVERIRRVLGADDELYRWGGEEFLVIFNDRDASALERDALRLLKEVESEPVPWHEQSMPVSVSGGYVHHPLEASWKAPLVDAIRWADAALYHAKNSGRRRVEFVELTEAGRTELVGRRPIDMPQLMDWQRRGYVTLKSLVTNSTATGAG